MFELNEVEECSGSYNGALPEEKLVEIVNNPYLQSVRKVPENFVIKFMDTSKFPSSLVTYWTTKKPLSKLDLYRLGVSIADFAKLMEEGAVGIEPYKYQEAMPLKARILIILALFLSLLYLFLPVNLLKFSELKFLEALNWAMKEKVLGGNEGKKELPVTDCLGRKLWLVGNAVVSPGIDGQLGTEDDRKEFLPKSGYKPFFAVPTR
jgi:hypothetical protein